MRPFLLPTVMNGCTIYCEKVLAACILLTFLFSSQVGEEKDALPFSFNSTMLTNNLGVWKDFLSVMQNTEAIKSKVCLFKQILRGKENGKT